MKKLFTFAIKHGGVIEFAISAITLAIVVVFLVAGNGMAAGISLCIGISLVAPLHIVCDFGISESNFVEKKE